MSQGLGAAADSTGGDSNFNDDSSGDESNRSGADGNGSASGRQGAEEGEGAGEREGAGLGEWDEDLGENISKDELSGLYSRISVMREREVEVMRLGRYTYRGTLCCCDGGGSVNQQTRLPCCVLLGACVVLCCSIMRALHVSAHCCLLLPHRYCSSLSVFLDLFLSRSAALVLSL